MAETHFSGPLNVTGDVTNAIVNPAQVSGSIWQTGNANTTANINNPTGTAEPTDAYVTGQFSLPITQAIVSGTGTRVAQITVPNAGCSWVATLTIRSATTAASHTYDSTRIVQYLLTVTRVAGANAVATLSSALNSTIATVSGGYTITSTLAAAAVSGGVTAVNTIVLNITNTVSTAGSSETQVQVEVINGAGGAYITA
jgi:hypothetical protein